MNSSELHLEYFKSASSVSIRPNGDRRDFKAMSFEQQSKFLIQLIYNRASLLYGDESKAKKLTETLSQLAAEDFYEVIDIMQDDSVFQNWICEFLESSTNSY